MMLNILEPHIRIKPMSNNTKIKPIDPRVFHIIPRIIKKDNTPILFLPDQLANNGMINTYMHIGQHSEASMEFYYKDTRPCKLKNIVEVQDLIDEYQNLLDADESLKIIHKDSASLRAERYSFNSKG